MFTSDPTFEQIVDDLYCPEVISLEETTEGAGAEAGFAEPVHHAAERPVPEIVPVPVHPLPVGPHVPGPIALKKRPVSGRYEGVLGGFRIELRVDVDRTRPMNRVSGDFYQVSGATTSYFGSFIVHSVVLTVTATTVTVRGTGTFTFAASAPVVQVTIPRRTVFQPQAAASLQFLTAGGSPGALYTCAFVSIYFRTLNLETDSVSDVTTPVFGSYNTGALPSGGSSRSLSVVSAYAEAGVQMVPTAGSNVINIASAGANATWSNAELHAAMVSHFTLYQNLPQWAVWQLVARLHDLGSGLYGIMFDQEGKHRQGCAVFHEGIGGITNEKLRLQLYTYVHELGHCFNLLHSWQKSYANPPLPNRPNALSWMNYPWNYPLGGAAAFWSNFAFQFDNEEIIHLRHAFRNNIIMGGSNFTSGSALGKDVLPDLVRDDSGLRLKISTHQESFALGEPVVLQIELGTTASVPRKVHSWLHPNFGMVKVVIQKPNGEVVAYEPLIDHLVGGREAFISGNETLKDSAYIGYGKGGFYFGQPGHYLIRAVYAAGDGSEILSDLIRVRVRYPVTAADASLADLFMGCDQGTLLYLLGSDSEFLRNGNAAFDEVLDRHGKSPMANYARLIKGINASRDFKTIHGETTIVVRDAELGESTQLLSTAATSKVLDSVTTQMTLSSLAEVQVKSGDETAARKTLNMLSAMA